MFLQDHLKARISAGNPVKALLIGAGKFGSMFLAQVPHTPGLEVAAIVDLNPDAARKACKTTGWSDAQIEDLPIHADLQTALETIDCDVVIEATGNPVAGTMHAQKVIAAGKHIIMVNVEADVLAGAHLAQQAREKGVVYSMAYGDQPALVADMIDWARSCGFKIHAAGKGTKYLPEFHASTPDTVWPHYGLTEAEAQAAGMNPKMFNSFLDGTKSALEMAAIANACDLGVPSDGLKFPPCDANELAHVLRPASEGGSLEASGMVETVSSLARDGSEIENDLRWGVYVVMEAQSDYAAACFKQYGLPTDPSGRFAAMYKPFHLIGMELGISVLSAALLNQATGSNQAFNGDVAATAKRALKKGETLDGEGGYTVWGKLIPSERAIKEQTLPIGLAADTKLTRDIALGEMITWADVDLSLDDPVTKMAKDLRSA